MVELDFEEGGGGRGRRIPLPKLGELRKRKKEEGGGGCVEEPTASACACVVRPSATMSRPFLLPNYRFGVFPFDSVG